MFHNVVAVFFFFVFFALMSLCAKKSEKTKLLGQEKNLKAQKWLKKSGIIFFNDIAPAMKKGFAFISENWTLLPN